MEKIGKAFEKTLEQIAETLSSIRKTKVTISEYYSCNHCRGSAPIPRHEYAFVEQTPSGENMVFAMPGLRDIQCHGIDDPDIDEKHLMMYGHICDPYEYSFPVVGAILHKFAAENYVSLSFYVKGALHHWSCMGISHTHPDTDEARAHMETMKLLDEIKELAAAHRAGK